MTMAVGQRHMKTRDFKSGVHGSGRSVVRLLPDRDRDQGVTFTIVLPLKYAKLLQFGTARDVDR